ncbi:hypothetical protein [Candidatus Parabeggiatoa sp. HSG14]|uniref:hypothetical protein n=1 Tax=Candidatus Parabeggiatoa sp. HSG14 TaxID=3055593 RepID=UPI0025A8BB17|nr:hypothetical protein [Thiotrichales bacterium HSG14]
MNDNAQFHKIPITLGITGHRDLREGEKDILREAVRKIFQFIQKHHPNTPLQLFSPLADGADRLVAQVALEENVQLIVPLPMPKDLYEIDFQTHDSKTEFDELLEKAQEKGQVFELPLLEDKEKIRSYGEARTKQYAFVGAYIARHSHILIALWDGLPLDKSGGTSQVVQFRLMGKMKDLPKCYQLQHGPLDIPNTGPVCHVVTSREGGEPLDLVGKIQILLPNNQNKSHLADLLSDNLVALNRFNQDVEKYANHPRLQRWIKQSQRYLLPEKIGKNFENLSPAFKTMLGVYGTANALARYFQFRLRQSTLAVLWIVGAMVGFYGWYNSLETNPIALISYLILFLVATAILWGSQWWHYHSKALDYRALAESLRVQIFWHLGGLTDSVTDHHLLKQQGELTWIRNSIQAINVYDWAENTESLAEIHSHWIKHQHEWFSKNTKKNLHKSEKFGKWINGFFVSTIALIVGLLAGQLTGIVSSHSFLHHLLILLIALVPATGALLHYYTEIMAFDEQAKQYERMTELFMRANDEMEKIIVAQRQNNEKTEEEYQKQAKAVLFELGKEALKENDNWLLLHRKRSLKLPKNS